MPAAAHQPAAQHRPLSAMPTDLPSTLPNRKCPKHPAPSRSTCKDCSLCNELICSRCGCRPKDAGRSRCATCTIQGRNRKKDTSDTSHKVCSRCHTTRRLDAFQANSHRCNKCRHSDKGQQKVRARSTPATERLLDDIELNTGSAELSALTTTYPSPSSSPSKSLLTKHYHISAADIEALRCADPQTLGQLLRPEDDCVHNVFTSFAEALESGRVQLWGGGTDKISWPGKDLPQLLRNWDCGLPKDLNRLCMDMVSNTPKNEPIQVYRQSGFAKATVSQAETIFSVTKSVRTVMFICRPVRTFMAVCRPICLMMSINIS